MALGNYRTRPGVSGRTITLGILALIFTSVGLGCIQRKPERLTRRESPVSAEMTELEQSARALNEDTLISSEVREAHLKELRAQVYDLLAQALMKEPEDLYRAAVILQMGDLTTESERLLLAHNLARQAVAKGYENARLLAAVCLDRYLVFCGRPQRYGTQYFIDSLGHRQQVPIDQAISDSERAAWGGEDLGSNGY